MKWRLSGYSIVGVLLMAVLLGMVGCSRETYIKRNVKGPLLRDVLTRGTSVGSAEGGTFSKAGWQPGAEGSITYDLPAMPQGFISMEVTGLSRMAPDAILLTLFEIPEMNYTDPYVIQNPYLITLKARNFQNAPESPFDFLWTIKNFPAGTDDENRYVDGIPEGVLGYQKTLASAPMPLFPTDRYIIQVEWFSGKARLYVNGQILAEHVYNPILFGADRLRLVVGKSPLEESFAQEGIIISNVLVSYPTVYRNVAK